MCPKVQRGLVELAPIEYQLLALAVVDVGEVSASLSDVPRFLPVNDFLSLLDVL